MKKVITSTLCTMLFAVSLAQSISNSPFLSFSKNKKDSAVWDSLSKLLEKDAEIGKHTSNELTAEIIGYFLQSKVENVSYRTVNYFSLKGGTPWISIAQVDSSGSFLKILNLVAEESELGFKFNLPLKHHTQFWDSTMVGNITYYHQEAIDKKEAAKFNQRNSSIATKLGTPVEKFDFYICQNYQEISQLIGFDFDQQSSAKTRVGLGIVGGTIFSIMGQEDFTHDIFHYYSGKVNSWDKRNWTTEEGIAYTWGNAYYTDLNTGEIITQPTLIAELKKYLTINPEKSLLQLFLTSEKIFNHLAPEISVRSTIASLICDEVEKKEGMEGIMQLINCGKRQKDMSNFLAATDKLIGINKSNFDEKVGKLLTRYN